MKYLYSSIVLFAFALFLSSCATAPPGAVVVATPDELPPIQQTMSTQLSALRIGTTIDEFNEILPNAYVIGRKGGVTAYEVTQVEKYVTQDDIDDQNFWWGFGSPDARTKKQALWFYFYKNRLIKWGEPTHWPENPETLVNITN